MNLVKRCLIFFPFATVIFFHCGKNPVSPEKAAFPEMQNKVNAISAQVAKLRGMDFVRPVHAGVISQTEYASSVKHDIANSISKIEEEALSKEYAQMGLLSEADTPLTKILVDFYSSFPAAYYVPGTDSLYILLNSESNESQLNMIIAHELTHALQDQRLTMQPMIFPGYSQYSSDASLAERALAEGDAMFTSFAYVYYDNSSPLDIVPYDSSRKRANEYKADILNATYSASRPIFLDVRSLVPYFLGVAYVAEIYHEAQSWSSVNQRYSISSVPRSSAEINRMTATPVAYFDFHALHDLLVSQTGTIEFADDDNAGFALLLGLFYGDLDPARTYRSLDWLGDRYTYVKRAGQAYGTFVWAMAFENNDAAQYLFGKLAGKIGSRRLAGAIAAVDSVSDTSGRGSTFTFTSASMTTRLKRIDNRIFWLENTDTLAQRIVDMLQTQQAAPLLAKAEHTNTFPASLSAETKMRVLKGVMNQVFKRKMGLGN
jgi:hypothetical protein